MELARTYCEGGPKSLNMIHVASHMQPERNHTS
jgi:hypothetical protein